MSETGRGAGLGTTRNYPLDVGTSEADYLATLDKALAGVRAFKPDWLVVRCVSRYIEALIAR